MSQAVHPQQAAEGEEESNDFRPQHNCVIRLTAFVLNHTTNATSSANQIQLPVQGRLATSPRRCDANRTAGRNIGVSQDIEHKGNGMPLTTFQPLPSKSLVMVSKQNRFDNSG